MRTCPDCPTVDPETGEALEPRPSRDQRAWVKDGRCYTCHDEIRYATAVRKQRAREARAWRIKPQFNAATFNWARV